MSTTPSLPRLCLLALVLAAPAAAQTPLSLHDALGRVDADGYANRIASAAADAAAARIGTTGRGILPTVRVEAGWLRSTDPLATFGFLMRQRLVTPQAFDPAALNDPLARSDLSSGLVLEAPLLNIDAWAGRSAANHAAGAATAHAEWVASGMRLDVIKAYFGAILAEEQVATLEAGNAAARSHVRQAESAAANGLVTRSDVLLVEVMQGEVETRLAQAEGQRAVARLQLALLLGSPGDTLFTLPRSVPGTPPTPDRSTIESRADLRMAEAAVAAAGAVKRAADAAFLPRVNAFARYDWHDPHAPFGGKAMWTVGVMASWSPFSGGAELAQRRSALADAVGATTGREAAEAAAALEVRAATIGVSVAVRALTIASQAVVQATEAHRIVGRKYAGGLAAVSELLDAQATELTTRLGEAKARYDLLTARATLARAQGHDLTTFAAALDAAAGYRE